MLSDLIELLVPLGKGSKVVSQGGGGFESKVMLKRRDIGFGDGVSHPVCDDMKGPFFAVYMSSLEIQSML